MNPDSSDNNQNYESQYTIGQHNIQKLGFDVHKPVFTISALLILSFVFITLFNPELANQSLSASKAWCIEHFDWFFMGAANFFLLFCLVLTVGPVGKIRLGGDGATTDFTTRSWLAMLFAAGVGIGLMFWGVAEPVAYYSNWFGTPLSVSPNTPEAAQLAITASVFHWGVHGWAFFIIVAVALAFFHYNKGLPLTIRSVFYPIIGDRCWGWPGHIIDISAVVATLFGLATSLGLGATQASSGLNYLFNAPDGLITQILVIVTISAITVISVKRGLQGGIKLLSNINMFFAFLLLCFVFLVGPSVLLLESFFNNIVDYAINIIPLSNWHDRSDESWMHAWTVFYWAWWVSWSPFVGMFIARISRGRTIRELTIAALFVPTMVVMLWFTVFGNTALFQAQQNIGELSNGISSVSLAMFQMLENLPFNIISSGVGILLLLIFFITSSDSGALVLDTITAGGKLETPIPQRIFWALLQGLIACALLYGGGAMALNALQAATITAALPFTAILLIMCLSLYKGLREYSFTNAK
ncbi:BCCT family transporter [Thalassotalea psychrophila]|uniref:BCCT family transporter n=1 Tax=Thalassotalea psychrophila TaxID=3065647 RepID=A0ABY9TUB4_9GAMM|nr:BCCT family transporter [Colwelliaceae bacterium SQ149]